MKTPQEVFDKDGYVVLKDALTKQQCDELVQHMFSLNEKGALVKDDQCPLSDAVYGDEIFDNLMMSFAEPLGKQLGKRLLPTYTYARIYRPGDVLKKHKDRPSCEISTTLTLGWDAKHSWPIYMDEQKETMVQMEVGEMVAYKGCEVLHWRKPFKGNWHCQVFLHYVDADGPFADHAFDGRKGIGMDKTEGNLRGNNAEVEQPKQMLTQPQPQQPLDISVKNPITNATLIPSEDDFFPGYFPIFSENLPQLMFTPQECDRLIQVARDSYPSTASVGGSSDNSRIARDIRKADIYNIENNDEWKWVYEKVAKIVGVANKVHFQYDITGITHSLQLIHYTCDEEIKGHYDWHIDAGRGEPATRKISFTAQLSNPTDYEGCELIVNDHCNEVTGILERGSVSLFPSYMPHTVTDISKGERFALVIWIHGSRRFK